MTKKRVILLAGLATGLVLAACLAVALTQREEPPFPTFDPDATYTEEESFYFEATVLRVDGDQLLVRPEASTSDVMAFDDTLVNLTMANGERAEGFREGQRIGILFDGKVAMSLPPRVTRVFGFFSAE